MDVSQVMEYNRQKMIRNGHEYRMHFYPRCKWTHFIGPFPQAPNSPNLFYFSFKILKRILKFFSIWHLPIRKRFYQWKKLFFVTSLIVPATTCHSFYRHHCKLDEWQLFLFRSINRRHVANTLIRSSLCSVM